MKCPVCGCYLWHLFQRKDGLIEATCTDCENEKGEKAYSFFLRKL